MNKRLAGLLILMTWFGGCGGELEVPPGEPLDGDDSADEGDALSEEASSQRILAAGASCQSRRGVSCPNSSNNCSYDAMECDPLPRALDRVSRTQQFPLVSTGHRLQDSLGNIRGIVTDASVKLNWGQRRIINGTAKVLAFSARTTNGTFSGWINEAAVARDLSWMPTVHAPDPGGTRSKWHVVASDNAPYLDGTGKSLKVLPTCEPGMNATDYLGRNGHANLIYNLPASSPSLGSGTIDSYPNDGSARIVFNRAQSQQSLERVLYSCATGRPVRTSRTLSFLYGHVDGASTRHGWIAMPNVKPGA